MGTYAEWSTALSTVFSQAAERLMKHLPNLLGALVLLLVGWLLARLLRALTLRMTRFLERLFSRVPAGSREERPKILSTSVEILGSIVFWVVILFSLTVATQVIGLAGFVDWLNRVAAYLPTLFTGGLIILAGFVVSVLLRDLVIATALAVPERQRVLLGRVVQTVTLVTAIVIGADQIGIKVTFLLIIATVVLVTVLGSAAVAVSLGARTYVSNLIGAHYLRQAYQVGQTIRIAGHEGTVLELTQTDVVLETADGRVTVPGKAFHEEPTVLVMGKDRDG